MKLPFAVTYLQAYGHNAQVINIVSEAGKPVTGQLTTGSQTYPTVPINDGVVRITDLIEAIEADGTQPRIEADADCFEFDACSFADLSTLESAAA